MSSLACDDCHQSEAVVWIIGVLGFFGGMTASLWWLVRSLWIFRNDHEAMSFVTPRWLRRIGNL